MSEKNSVLKWKIISAISTTCCIAFGALYFNKRVKECETIENDKVNSTNADNKNNCIANSVRIVKLPYYCKDPKIAVQKAKLMKFVIFEMKKFIILVLVKIFHMNSIALLVQLRKL